MQIKYGVVSEYSSEKGQAKVHFDSEDIVSDWLPILSMQTKATKESHPLEVNEHVACVMDEFADTGVILGAIYNDDEKPSPTAGADIYEIVFKNHDYIRYDALNRKYDIKFLNTQMIISPVGFALKKSSESLRAILGDLVTGMIAETHGSLVGPTTPPINVATYVSILARLNLFFIP